ncbi:MAG: hypothetical protein M3O70_28985 [Actinomycetota bacterium]|nr:hypothetical protein [Actinomycetota bacterium]
MKKMLRALTFVLALAILAGTALATVTFNPATGEGFVGKGDVQYTFGWNNKQLQDNLKDVKFTYVATETKVTEQSWECTNTKNEKIQERERTTTETKSVNGVVSAVARERNQITGVNLTGYSSKAETSTSTTEGPKVNSCPDASGNWTLTSPAGDPVLVSETSQGGLYVSHPSVNGGNPVPLQEKPEPVV